MFTEYAKRMDLKIWVNKSITVTLFNREIMSVSKQELNYSTLRYYTCFTKSIFCTNLLE